MRTPYFESITYMNLVEMQKHNMRICKHDIIEMMDD